MYFKCACSGIDNIDKSIGRYLGPKYRLAELSINDLENIVGQYDNLIECPWHSFYDPLWIEIKHYLNLKEIPGTTNINDSTDNIVYEAVLFYNSCYTKIDNHINKLEMELRELERSKAKASKSFMHK